MTGKILAVAIVLTALVAGGAMYYLQVYHYYQEIGPRGPADVQIVATRSGLPEPLAHDGFRAIDATSSPLRYRACFTTPLRGAALDEVFVAYDHPEPLTAPGWFDCFDAAAIGQALEDGRAQAFLGEKDIRYGFDRVIAITDDGHGYVWHQINDCGEIVFDGKPAPEHCPEPPAGY